MLVTLIALLAISFIVSMLVESFLVTQRTQTQLEETTRLSLEIAPDLLAADTNELYALIVRRAQEMGGRLLIMDTDAVVQLDSASYQTGFRLPYREVRDVLIGGKEASFGFHKIERGSDEQTAWGLVDTSVWAVYYAAPITADGVYVGAVVFSALLQDVEDSVAEIIRQIAIAFTLVALVMAVLTFALSRLVTKPIAVLTGAIRRMGKQTGVRVDIKGSDEMAELGEAFNRMSEQIEDHDRIRDEFVSNASHELKTPLATMKLLSESILYDDHPDPALMKEFFGDVSHEVDRLSGVINDLLRLVKFDQSEEPLQPERVRFDKITRQAVERLRPMAKKKGVELTCSTPEEIIVRGEANRLDQVVSNLVENALKYTDKGSVRVRLVKDGEDALLEVRDTGIGIPQEAIPHVFERFYRVDKARSRDTGGTGLGLSIVEKIVSMHGGDINVESELGRGSAFIVRIPFAGKEDEDDA
ncbi:MAG TPA: HAMP domain-containing sensor histidine kinase [Clostridia bacterium]|nr:HAMP domain-containing sensor histidine kinase [Clostridia bacterium]